MRKMHLLLLALVLGSTSQALAQDEEMGEETGGEESSVDTVNEPVKEAASDVEAEMRMDTTKGGYGSAGCGLGSLLFEPSNGFTQVFAATTNGTSGTQTFGITSGTSNCDAAGYSGGSAKVFIETNRAALAKDVSRGKGATVTALTDVAGCRDSQAVGKTLQKNFKTIFPSAGTSDKEVSESMVKVLRSDESLSCTNLV